MFNYATNEVRYRGLRIPRRGLIGEEGEGFRYVLDGWNAERILLAAEAIGDGYWFTDRASEYAAGARCSGARSAPTRACSSRSPAPTCRSAPPT